MDTVIANTTPAARGAHTIRSAAIQSLWSGYGEIVRLELTGSSYRSVVLKHHKLLAAVGKEIVATEGIRAGLQWLECFHRALKSCGPGHWQINSYSEQLTQRLIERLQP